MQPQKPHFFIGPFLLMGVIFLAGLLSLPITAQAQTTATLNILNTANAAGDIVISKGTSVEVDFDVTGDSSKNDELQLIRVDDNAVVSKKKRGTSPQISVFGLLGHF